MLLFLEHSHVVNLVSGWQTAFINAHRSAPVAAPGQIQLEVERIVERPGVVVALTVILSGAIGNLIDRVALGYVRDFIAFDFMNFPVFNFADSCITVGAVLLIVSVLFTKSGRAYFAALDEKKQKPEKAGAEPDVKQAESK